MEEMLYLITKSDTNASFILGKLLYLKFQYREGLQNCLTRKGNSSIIAWYIRLPMNFDGVIEHIANCTIAS